MKMYLRGSSMEKGWETRSRLSHNILCLNATTTTIKIINLLPDEYSY
jgi:hypothetical protein